MIHPSVQFNSSTLTGMRYGVATWTAYALTEFLYTSLQASVPESGYSSWHWAFNVGLSLVYLFIGLLIGAAVGLLISRLQLAETLRRSTLILVIVAEALLAILALNIFLFTFHGPTLWPVLGCLMAAAAIPLRFPRLLHQRRVLSKGNFTLVVLLASVAIFAGSTNSTPIRLFGLAGMTWLLGTYLFVRVLSPPSSQTSSSPPRRLRVASLVGTLALIFAIDSLRIQSGFRLPFKSKGSQIERRPNVMLVVLDTVRADHLSTGNYSRATSPALATFAADATLYENALSPGDMTLSAHASMFTGLYPRTHGAHFSNVGMAQPLAEHFTTIAEALASHGYRTAGVVSNYGFFGKGIQLDQGFEYMDAKPADGFHLLEADPLFFRNVLHKILSEVVPDSVSRLRFRDAGEISVETLRILKDSDFTRQSFFLFVNFMDAHSPYTPPSGFDTLYPGKLDGFSRSDELEITQSVTITAERVISARERNHLVSQYDGAITYVDSRFQSIIDQLKQAGLYDDMLIIVTSDHGEAFGERQLIQHAVSVYQDQLHVPLLIRYPRGAHRGIVRTPVSTVSVMPTILEVVGITPARRLHAVSLASGGALVPSDIIAESYPATKLLGERFNRIERALIRYPYKFITSTSGKRELYNLEYDPDETSDLYDDKIAVAQELEKALDVWLEATEDESAHPSDHVMSQATRERLKALGYIK